MLACVGGSSSDQRVMEGKRAFLSAEGIVHNLVIDHTAESGVAFQPLRFL